MKRWFEPDVPGQIGFWGKFTSVLIVCHFAIPFVLMMSRWGKRRIKILSGFAIYTLLWHYVDLYWQVMPALNNHMHPSIGAPESGILSMAYLDIILAMGMGLLFMGAVASALSKVNLIAKNDPGLKQSLRFENQ